MLALVFGLLSLVFARWYFARCHWTLILGLYHIHMLHQEVTRLCVKYMTRKVTRKVTRKRAPAMTPNNGDCSSHKSDPSWRVTLVTRKELNIDVFLAFDFWSPAFGICWLVGGL